MLNYKVKLSEPQGYDEISVEGLYLSTDLSYISGVTNLESNLIDGQTIMIEFNKNNKFIEATVNCKKVQRQGYVIYNQKYKVIEYGDYKGYWFNDGKFHFTEENADEIEVPTKYWVTDGKLTIDYITYDVDIELYRNDEGKYVIDEEYPPYVTIRGDIDLPINKCNLDDRYYVIEFIIKKNPDFILKVEDISCAERFPYVSYGMDNVKQYNDKQTIINGNNIKHYFKYDYNINEYVTDIDGNQYQLNIDRVTIDDNDYIVEYEWRNVPLSETLHLFLDNTNFNFVSGQRILAETVSTIKNIVFKNDENSILYCGKSYTISDENDTVDYVVLLGTEYEVTYTSNQWGLNGDTTIEGSNYGYIVVNSEPILVCINESNYYAPYNEFSGIVKSYRYVTIDDKKYLLKSYQQFNNETNQLDDIDYVEIIKNEKYVLNVDEVISNSMLRCHPIVGENGDYRSVCSTIVSNKKLMKFSLFNPLFDERNVNIDTYINDASSNGTFDVISLFNPSGYIEIPLLVGNNFMNNSLQENIVENFFFKKEKEEAINPIVDMEKEIYYPSYKSDDGKKLINEIVFDLHFRSRNLNDWKINEDLYSTLENTSENALKLRYNWNLFDYYNWFGSDKTKPNVSNENEVKNGFYQPADLLYFLNFTDDDVFYQKSKIGKSFLRLLFFNSNNPNNQSLLYSCTVFMDENKYYKTYTDNMLNNKQEYISVVETDSDPLTSNTFNISSDTSVNGEVTFDESIRLSSSFHIKNRYEMGESAEGFYLYIFKEYCEKLHEEPIYLKVEFNHAGVGRTINFIMPYMINGNDFVLYDLSNESQYEEFSKGIRLNELYEYLYIPLESVYDDVNKRYCYYMPDWMCEHNDDKESVMRFNLYELKIMDESNENN